MAGARYREPMADQRFRELERRFQETGDAADEAAYLAHGLRTGELDRERVAVAAWVGHAPARAVLGEERQPPQDDDRETWIRLTFPAVEAAVLASFPHMPDKDRYPGPARGALADTRAWLRTPNEEAFVSARNMAGEFWSDPKSFMPGSEPEFYVALRAAHYLVQAVAAPPVADSNSAALEEHRHLAAFYASRNRPPPPEPVPIALRPQCEEAVRCALQALVVVCGVEPEEAKRTLRAAQLRDGIPWLLGRRDPVRERAFVPPERQAQLSQAEAHAAAAPGELAAVERLVAVCDDAGWTWDGKTLAAWRAQLCGDWNLAKVAIGHLGELGARAVPAALAALASDSYQTPGFGVQLLHRLGPDASAAVPTLLRYLEQDATHGISGPTAWISILGWLRAEAAVPLLIRNLGGQCGSESGQALLRIGAPAVEPLRAFLFARPQGVDDAAVRFAACVLAELGDGDQRIVSLLGRILAEHPWTSARTLAVSALLTLGRAHDFVDAIVSWLRTEENENKHAPVEVLGILGVGPTHPGARAALEPLREIMDQGNLALYAQAALAGHPPEGADWRHPCWRLPDR